MRGILAAVALPLSLAACSPSIEGLDETALADLVGAAIGDPGTCVLLVDKSAEVVWRYGTHMTCARTLPACEGGGTTTVQALANAAAQGGSTAQSCPSSDDGSRSVGWASGAVASAKTQPLFYAALMEGERALPGREIKARLEGAFAEAGL